MIHSPSPLNVARATVEAFGLDAAKAFRVKPGDDLVPVVSRIGGVVRYKNFIAASDATALVCQPDAFQIFIPDHTTSRADNFDVAQNLGFRLMHYPMVQKAHGKDAVMSVGRYARPRHAGENDWDLERVHTEGLWFAYALLMPELEFRKAWDRAKGSLADIAEEFKIVGRHVHLRACGLGLT